jgi:hypothetical protein
LRSWSPATFSPFAGYTQCDNALVWIEDVERAQRFADRLASVNWPRVLNRHARRINPHLGKLLGRMEYYWVTAQCEWATDVMFRRYDKVGSVLRVETVINAPAAFKVRQRVWREGRQVTEWVPLRKGVANRFRYRDVSLAANARYLDALAIGDDPSTAIRQLHSISGRKRTRSGQSVRAFNPLSEADQRRFKALLSGDNAINGFRNRDIRERLAETSLLRACGKDRCKQSAKVTRMLKRLHRYGLITKIPRSRRWRLTKKGWALLSASVSLKEDAFPRLHLPAAA